jgi:tetratricopeptide (TPR) repeat protein
MVRRDLAGLAAMAGLAVATAGGRPSIAVAQPATGTRAGPDAPADSNADLARAKQLYQSAEAAMQDGRFDDAIRDYGAAYQASEDPALLYKLGRAHERAGRCDTALAYYGRYLRAGAPSPPFVATTRARIVECGGDPTKLGAPEAEPAPPAPAAHPAGPAPAPSTPEPEAPPPIATPNNRQKAAWLVAGSGIALAALGGILAYAASSSESDIRDLYIGFGGAKVTFDSATRRRYQDLVDQGHNYEHLSWGAFGLAGAAAVGTVVLFVTGREPAHSRIAPIVTTTTAGVAVAF